MIPAQPEVVTPQLLTSTPSLPKPNRHLRRVLHKYFRSKQPTLRVHLFGVVRRLSGAGHEQAAPRRPSRVYKSNGVRECARRRGELRK